MIAKKNKFKNRTKQIIKAEEIIPRGRWFFTPLAKKIYIFVLTLIAIVAMLSYDFTPNIEIELGRPAPRTIRSHRNLEFEDPVKTEEHMLRNEAAVEDVYAYDSDALTGEDGTLYNIRYFFNLVSIVQRKSDSTFEEKVDYLNNLTGNRYTTAVLSQALRLNVEERELLSTNLQNISREVMRQAIRPTELELARQRAADMVREEQAIPTAQTSLAVNVLEETIQPTAVFDPDATQRARLEARMETPPAMISILEGQTIVYEGEIVGGEDIAILQRLGLLERDFNWSRFLYILFISSVVLYLFGFYIYKFNRKVFDNFKKLMLIAIILVVFTGVIKVLTVLASIHLPLWNYLFPVIAASMIATIIFESRIAIMLTICMAVFLGIATDLNYSITIAYLLGAIFSTYLVSNISQRSTVMRAGFISSLMLGFLFFTINIGADVQNIALYTMLGVLNGIICAILTIGLLPFIESTFNIVTAMGLLELSHTDQPLLKELLISSPGTYNHSLLMGHLAENAAKAIGADALLVKVAALYHDLGKMKRPEYFYENQANIENLHDKLNPSMSRNIIANHIKDGVEVAIKNKIPKRVVEIISQHHGSSVISYFYEKQKGMETLRAANGSANGLKGHFRYPAKKPQSKEAAVLMLADSAEAAVRSIDKMTPKKIEQMINDIVEDKINDGQLNEANITLKEIDTVRKSLIDGLISIHHSRITYPEPVKESVEVRK